MINVGTFFKGILVIFGSFAVSYSILHTQNAPPLGTSPEYAPSWQNYVSGSERKPRALNDSVPPSFSSATGPLPQLTDVSRHIALFDDRVLTPLEQNAFLRMNARRGEPLMTPEEFLQAINTPSAIMPLNQSVPRLIVPPQDRDRVMEVVQINRGKLETLFPGDEMYLYSDYLGNSLVMVVDSVVDHLDGTLTWYGHLKDTPQDYRVSFTQGPLFTLASLPTPQGHYTLEAHGEYGWLMQAEPGSPFGLGVASYAARLSRYGLN